MTELSPRLAMPFIMPAQAQKHVTHNEALELLDSLVQMTLQSIDEPHPPAAPQDGQAWCVAAGATDAWAGQDGQIACWRGGGWMYLPVPLGCLAWVQDRAELHVYDGGQWLTKGQAPSFDQIAEVGINTSADAANRLAVAADATLLTHAGAGHQCKINKATAADTASLLFQTGYAGRAEMGLAGTDAFAVKVSADGATWHDALRVTPETGKVNIATVLYLTPGTVPVQAVAGDIYFDSAAAMLRCFDGALWRDLFA